MLFQCLHTFPIGLILSLRIDGLYFAPDVFFAGEESNDSSY